MNEAEARNHETELDEAEVAAYIQAHPDFLRRHPAALEALNISHASGNAVSLIERQVDTLRASNQQLQASFNDLIEKARDNEQRVVQLNRLARVLVAAETAEQLVPELAFCLEQHLDVDRIYIGLDGETPLAGGAIHALGADTPAGRALTNVFRRGKPICGPLSDEQSEALFATQSEATEPLASAAMVPLGSHGVRGALVLASHNPSRFAPDVGTLFLELAGDLVTAALRRLLGDDALS